MADTSQPGTAAPDEPRQSWVPRSPIDLEWGTLWKEGTRGTGYWVAGLVAVVFLIVIVGALKDAFSSGDDSKGRERTRRRT